MLSVVDLKKLLAGRAGQKRSGKRWTGQKRDSQCKG